MFYQQLDESIVSNVMLSSIYPDKNLTVMTFDRFHVTSEFDEKKRSCRKSLADHNRRRRKRQPTTSAASQCQLGTTGLEDGNQETLRSSGHDATG